MEYIATAVSQEVAKVGAGLTLMSVAATVVYALLGVIMMFIFMWLANILFKLNLRSELVKDNNIGLGVAVAGMAIAIAIIIAGTISS